MFCSRFISTAILLFALMSPLLAADAFVTVRTHPERAKIYVNGYFKAYSPEKVTITSASSQEQIYRFTLIKPGYEKWDMNLKLAAGANKSIDAYLKQLPDALSGKTICIDPGHPSETSAGCTGPSGVKENHINWVIAQKLRDKLVAHGATVVMTKNSENEKVTNRKRAEIANAAGADVMIRLHCDAASRSGFSLYYPDREGTKYGYTGPPENVRAASSKAARAIHAGMQKSLSGTLPSRGVHGDSATYVGSKQGALTGSIFAEIPTVTIEMCVLTVASDERLISSADGQSAMVNALYAGLETYFNKR